MKTISFKLSSSSAGQSLLLPLNWNMVEHSSEDHHDMMIPTEKDIDIANNELVREYEILHSEFGQFLNYCASIGFRTFFRNLPDDHYHIHLPTQEKLIKLQGASAHFSARDLIAMDYFLKITSSAPLPSGLVPEYKIPDGWTLNRYHVGENGIVTAEITRQPGPVSLNAL